MSCPLARLHARLALLVDLAAWRLAGFVESLETFYRYMGEALFLSGDDSPEEASLPATDSLVVNWYTYLQVRY